MCPKRQVQSACMLWLWSMVLLAGGCASQEGKEFNISDILRTGPKEFIMPDLTGKTIEEATAVLKHEGWRADAPLSTYLFAPCRETPIVEPGRICNQSVRPGATTSVKTLINVIINKQEGQRKPEKPKPSID